jgi:hypothetical protein
VSAVTPTSEETVRVKDIVKFAIPFGSDPVENARKLAASLAAHLHAADQASSHAPYSVTYTTVGGARPCYGCTRHVSRQPPGLPE